MTITSCLDPVSQSVSQLISLNPFHIFGTFCNEISVFQSSSTFGMSRGSFIHGGIRRRLSATTIATTATAAAGHRLLPHPQLQRAFSDAGVIVKRASTPAAAVDDRFQVAEGGMRFLGDLVDELVGMMRLL